MSELAEVAPAFLEMAHRIVWAGVATTDRGGRPRTRILHPIWEWDGELLVGWIGTSQSPVKTADLARQPSVSVNYWAADHDTAEAGCRAEWRLDGETCTRVWNLFKAAPEPLGYDPGMVPAWTSPTDGSFAVLRLEPHRLRVFPGTVLMGQGGAVLTWRA
ncbi:MAG: pyridoxamine 5'-phosphate oxidase family protein [Dehalococcoidia bacterium]|nr:pyridoxamine 5'-phosphate oxidase family protein [Dehalococcoidia bacterium]